MGKKLDLAKKYGEKILWIFVGIFISMGVTAIQNPPITSVSVEPMQNPIFKGDDYYARFYVVNSGNQPLSNIIATYQFRCFMNDTEKANMLTDYLRGGDRTFFDVPFGDNMNYQCSWGAEIQVETYKDNRGKLYTKCVNVTSKVCMYCNVTISLSVKEIPEIQNYNFMYPFSEGDLSTEISEGCVSQEEVDRMNWTYYDTIGMGLFDLSTPCLMGKDLDWCKEQGYI